MAKEENQKFSRKIIRVSTGVKGIDRITQGGFEKKSINLLVGGSGNGKSVFAMQFLINGLENNETCLYINFEERKDEFYNNMYELGWDLEKYEKSGKFIFLSYTPEKVRTMLEEGGGAIESIVLEMKVQRIAIDSITAFAMLFEDAVERREAALSLFSLLRKWDCTCLLTYERDPLVDKRENSRVLEFESDSVILLYFIRIKRKRERFLEVIKMRGTDHSTEIFSYQIASGGISVSEKPYEGETDSFK